MSDETLTDYKADEWYRVWYQEAQEDIRWAKERGWTLMYAGVVFFSAFVFLDFPPILGNDRFNHDVLRPLVFIVFLAVIYWLADLRSFAARRREYVIGLSSKIPVEPMPLKTSERPKDRHHFVHFVLQAGVVSVAAIGAVVKTSGEPVPYGWEWFPLFTPALFGATIGLKYFWWNLWGKSKWQRLRKPTGETRGQVPDKGNGPSESGGRLS